MSGGAVNLKVAAAHMAVSERTLRRRLVGDKTVVEVADGIRAIRVCGQWRVPVDELEAVFGVLPVESQPPEVVYVDTEAS